MLTSRLGRQGLLALDLATFFEKEGYKRLCRLIKKLYGQGLSKNPFPAGNFVTRKVNKSTKEHYDFRM